MTLVDQDAVDAYLEAGDWILELLDNAARPGDERFVTDCWLRESPPKRLLFDRLYGDLLREGPRREVLDVGGGFTSLTRVLLERHAYKLADLMAHDDRSAVTQVEQELGTEFLRAVDWYASETGEHDVVIANDLFPNVDQRIALFLDRYVPVSREVRLSLAYYVEPRFYVTQRVDADEILVMLAWDGRQLRAALEPYRERIEGERLELLTEPQPASVYPNGRQIAIVTLCGDRG